MIAPSEKSPNLLLNEGAGVATKSSNPSWMTITFPFPTQIKFYNL